MAGFPYFPHTDADVQSMLDRIGVKKVEDLYADVPKEFVKKGAYALPDAMSEPEVRAWLNGLAGMNAKMKVFAGAGAYDHYTPSVIPYITSRSEFLTAYTPYQCEISQFRRARSGTSSSTRAWCASSPAWTFPTRPCTTARRPPRRR